jgi:hypothetical protein
MIKSHAKMDMEEGQTVLMDELQHWIDKLCIWFSFADGVQSIEETNDGKTRSVDPLDEFVDGIGTL